MVYSSYFHVLLSSGVLLGGVSSRLLVVSLQVANFFQTLPWADLFNCRLVDSGEPERGNVEIGLVKTRYV